MLILTVQVHQIQVMRVSSQNKPSEQTSWSYIYDSNDDDDSTDHDTDDFTSDESTIDSDSTSLSKEKSDEEKVKCVVANYVRMCIMYITICNCSTDGHGLIFEPGC